MEKKEREVKEKRDERKETGKDIEGEEERGRKIHGRVKWRE